MAETGTGISGRGTRCGLPSGELGLGAFCSRPDRHLSGESAPGPGFCSLGAHYWFKSNTFNLRKVIAEVMS